MKLPSDLESQPARPNEIAGQLVHNAYLTDGRRLFRCLESRDGREIMLEDCLTLDLLLCQVEDIERSGIRLVRPGRPLENDGERPFALAGRA